MKKYCFDTSGISNPLETMPEDIHEWMWEWFCDFIRSGAIAVTTEIYDEMCHIEGTVGDTIRDNKPALVLEIEFGEWDWEVYTQNIDLICTSQHDFISEYSGGSPKTVCLNDISIVALAKTLGLPVVSMESFVRDAGAKKRRIPNVCEIEGVQHLTFNQCLRTEKARK